MSTPAAPETAPKKRVLNLPSSSQPKKQPKVETQKPPSIKDKLLSQLNNNKGPTATVAVNKRGIGPPPVIRSTSTTNKYKEYSDKYTRLLKLELEDELTSVEERLKSWTTSRLENEGICLHNLRCEIGRSFGTTKGITLRFSSDKSLEKGRFNHGDMVLLSRDNSLKNSISGVVLDKNPSWIQVLVSDVPDRAEQSYWRIDKGANRVSFDRMQEAIRSFTDYNENKCDLRGIICGSETGDIMELAKKRPNFETTSSLGFSKKGPDWTKLPSLDELGLNESQREAIYSGLTCRLTLIQGPPGTGKTRTAVLLLKKIIEFHGANCPLILASADTNVAVDNLLEGLLEEGIRAIRVGQPVKVRKSLREHTLHSLTENHPDARALREEKDLFLSMAKKLGQTTDPNEIEKIQGLLRGSQTRTEALELEVVRKVLKGAQVICSTCIGSGHEMLAAMSFPIVLVDEATQATEPSVLVPLVHKSKQVILLGDHFQLPPTVISKRASQDGLSKSLFQRLAEAGLQPNLLNIQYRMHPALSYFPTSAFYNGKVTDGITSDARPTPPGFPFPNPDFPVAFRAVKGFEDTTAEGSKYNKHDASVVTRIVRDLLCAQGGITGSQLGVISPYSGQVRTLAKYFEKLGPLAVDVDINSVDGYQGREKEVIIFSTVRSNEEGKVGFLSDWRRLNVALTRARRGLIVVGNPETLSTDPYWKEYLAWIEESKLMVKDNFFYTGPTFDPSAASSSSATVSDVNMTEVKETEETSQPVSDQPDQTPNPTESVDHQKELVPDQLEPVLQPTESAPEQLLPIPEQTEPAVDHQKELVPVKESEPVLPPAESASKQE